MRRRHVRSVREEESPTLLLMAAGAVAGAAAGLYLGRRYRSFDAFLADMRDRFGDLRSIWYDDDLAAQERGARIADMVNDFDDDYEPDELDDVEDDEIEEDDEFDDETSARIHDDVEDEDNIDDDEAEDDDDLETFEDDSDELEAELAAAASVNGVTASRTVDKARRLEERVLDALGEEPLLGARAIEIAVVGDGVVELTGTVHAIEEVARASALVRSVPGVSMVLNRIDVRSGGTMDTASVPRDPIQAPGDDDRSAPNG
jgi:osmotically-inducible protein OsmY